MMFLAPGPAGDGTYRRLRDADHPFAVESREHVEALWSMAESYAEPQVGQRARSSFHAAYWELYLAAALVEARLPVVPYARRRVRDKGPDFQVGTAPVKAWIEATTATAGRGVDQVREPGNRVRSVPDEGIKLRLLASIHEKKVKYEHYVETGIVSANEPFVIAINGALVPSAFFELGVPRIVRTVFPFGHEVLELDLLKREITGSHHEHSDFVGKASGASVATDGFERSENAGISAVLYSHADVWNPIRLLGGDFIVVHNPLATSPLPHGFLNRGLEYWREADELKCLNHNLQPSGH